MNRAIPVGGRTAGLSGRKRTDAAAMFSFVLMLSLGAQSHRDHRSRSGWMQHQSDSRSCQDDNLVTPVAGHRPMPPLATRVASDRKRSVNESARLLAILASRCPLSIAALATWRPCPSELPRPEQRDVRRKCAALLSRAEAEAGCVPTVYNRARSDQHIAHTLTAQIRKAHSRLSARQRTQQERMAFTGNITRDSSCQRMGRSSMEP